jgi:hypothetical protein
VWINDERWADFDADALTVRLPSAAANSQSEPLRVRALAFGCERVALDTDIFLVGASEEVMQVLRQVGFLTEVTPVVDVSEIAPLARG